MTYDNAGAQLSDQERADVLQKAWRCLNEQNYHGIAALLQSLSSEELDNEPALRFLYANALWRLGNGDQGLGLLRNQSTEYNELVNDRIYRSRLNLEAILLLERGEIGQAESLWLKALEAADAERDEWILSCVYTNLGVVHDIRCEWQQAIIQFQRSMASFKRLGDHRGVAWGHHNIAMTHRQLGNLSESADHFERALYLERRFGSEDDVARSEIERALLMISLGNYTLSQTLGLRALGRFQKLGDERNEGEAFRILGIIGQRHGNYLIALGYYRRALRSARRTDNILLQAEVLEEMAVYQNERHRQSRTRLLAEAAEQLYFSLGSEARALRLRHRLDGTAPL